jgi:hypothetical protein
VGEGRHLSLPVRHRLEVPGEIVGEHLGTIQWVRSGGQAVQRVVRVVVCPRPSWTVRRLPLASYVNRMRPWRGSARVLRRFSTSYVYYVSRPSGSVEVRRWETLS